MAADLIKRIKVGGVDKQIDYESLANLPTIPDTLSDDDNSYGQRVKEIEDFINNPSTPVTETINPGSSTTVPAGIYESASTITASLADSADEIDSTLKTAGTTETIVPGGSTTVSGGKFYTSDTTISASKATTLTQIDDSIKAVGGDQNLVPGNSITISGGKYYIGDSVITANKAAADSQISDAIKESKTVTAPLTGSTDVTPTIGKVMTKVTVNAPDTSGTATADDILSGKTAYVDGVELTGNIDNADISFDMEDRSMEANVTIDSFDNQEYTWNNATYQGSTLTIIRDTEPTTDNFGYVKVSINKDSIHITPTIKVNTKGYTDKDEYTGDDITITLDDATYYIPVKPTYFTYDSLVPGQKINIGSGYLSTDVDMTISLATTADQIDDTAKETKTVDGSLTSDVTVTPTTGKVMTSVTVTKPDMSSADVTADDIVSGKKAYGSDGTLITGTHEETSGTTDTTDATATAADIVSGKTAYVADGKVTGTLEVVSVYSGSSIPSASVGDANDIYILTT